MENFNYKTFSINAESANVNLTFKNGGINQRPLFNSNADANTRKELTKLFKDQYGLDYNRPQDNFITRRSWAGITPTKNVNFRIKPGADLEISPQDRTIKFKDLWVLKIF